MLRKNNVLRTMKKLCCIGLLCIVLAGCKSKIPGDIIQPDKMAAVLYDIHVTDGYIGTIPRQDSAKIVAASYYKGVYRKFGIDSAKYNSSMDYYYAHPDVLGSIYNKVTVSLKKSKDSLDKIAEKKAKLETGKRDRAAKKTKDSLAKVNALLQRPAELKKAKADSLKKRKTDSLKKINTIKNKRDSLKKAINRKKVMNPKKAIDARKFKSEKTAVEIK